MKKELISLGTSFLTLMAILFVAGGFSAVNQGLDVVGQTFIHIFPLFKPLFIQSIKDYLTSAYFIVGIIIFVSSSFGVFYTIKQKKFMYLIISAALNVISLLSIFSNFSACR